MKTTRTLRLAFASTASMVCLLTGLSVPANATLLNMLNDQDVVLISINVTNNINSNNSITKNSNNSITKNVNSNNSITNTNNGGNQNVATNIGGGRANANQSVRTSSTNTSGGGGELSDPD